MMLAGVVTVPGKGECSASLPSGLSPLPPPGSPTDEETKEKSDSMPNISDVMLRKLKLHRGLPGWCVTMPNLTAKTCSLIQRSLCSLTNTVCFLSIPVHLPSQRKKLR